ncbi:Dehydrin protein [Dioscorea alata]|uniref:Dehydrin protein n=1 Tax=Dioscorea alata TaxID=55571 RepID=A0ACB7WPQ9_DIOAL|nr:Dehydrin protein [Dioscorea alata]
MAEEEKQVQDVEVKERGLLDFMGKKEEKKEDEELVFVSRVEKVEVEEKPNNQEKHGILEKLQRTHSSSSSSSDEEEIDENGEKKRKKKKGLTEKIKEKLSTGEEEKTEVNEYEKSSVVTDDKNSVIIVEKLEGTSLKDDETPAEENKGFLEKIKEKLPMQSKKPSEEEVGAVECKGSDKEEKKGFLEKIKEKLPGYHKNEKEEVTTESNANASST